MTSCPARANGSRPSGPTCGPAPAASGTGPDCSCSPSAGDRISALTRFDNGVLPSFGLPRSLPAESHRRAIGFVREHKERRRRAVRSIDTGNVTFVTATGLNRSQPKGGQNT